MQGMRVQDLLIPEEKPSQDSAAKEKRPTKPNSTSSEIKYFVIEFIHDTICPFCYIGMKNLLLAIDMYKSRHPNDVFEVTCTPFILAPDAKTSYYDKVHYYSTERGLPMSRFELWNRLGENAGIRFSWNGRTGNSRNSHKLLRFALQKTPTRHRSTELTIFRPTANAPPYPPFYLRAPDQPVSLPQPRGPDLQMRLLDAITMNYHEHDKDLSDPQFLMETARAVTGFSEDEIRAVLDSPEWDRTIDMLSSEVQNRLSVRSQLAGPIVAVPTMVLNNRWVYGGFQKVDGIVNQFELLRRGISPLQEYTTSSLVLDGGIADTIAREAAMARGNDNKGGGSSGSGSRDNKASNENNKDETHTAI
ncbi:thioredoxin-like protein [Xylaria cubensis]|nr:thioredoxin-like protein [Xylaria cubensis]